MEIKKTFFIQSVDSFVSGVLTIVLPLLLLDRNISIVEIGVIFSIWPLVFQLTRLSFGIASDFIGRKIFFIFSGFMATISSVIYYFAHTPLSFLFGKIGEGLRDGSLWAVNRACVLDHSKEKRKKLVHLRTLTAIAEATGNLLAGFLIAWILYYNTILFCAIVATLMIPVSFSIKDLPRPKFSFRKALSFLDFRNRNEIFKKFLIFYSVYGLSDGFITGYIFTSFLKQGGLSAELIGVIIGLKLLITGISTYFFTDVKFRKLLLLGSIFYPLTLFFLGHVNIILASFLLILFGIANGPPINVHEELFSKIAKSESYAGDIGLLMTSFHIGRAVSQFASGFLILAYGFSSVFVLSSIALLIYNFSVYKTVKV